MNIIKKPDDSPIVNSFIPFLTDNKWILALIAAFPFIASEAKFASLSVFFINIPINKPDDLYSKMFIGLRCILDIFSLEFSLSKLIAIFAFALGVYIYHRHKKITASSNQGIFLFVAMMVVFIMGFVGLGIHSGQSNGCFWLRNLEQGQLYDEVLFDIEKIGALPKNFQLALDNKHVIKLNTIDKESIWFFYIDNNKNKYGFSVDSGNVKYIHRISKECKTDSIVSWCNVR